MSPEPLQIKANLPARTNSLDSNGRLVIFNALLFDNEILFSNLTVAQDRSVRKGGGGRSLPLGT